MKKEFISYLTSFLLSE